MANKNDKRAAGDQCGNEGAKKRKMTDERDVEEGNRFRQEWGGQGKCEPFLSLRRRAPKAGQMFMITINKHRVWEQPPVPHNGKPCPPAASPIPKALCPIELAKGINHKILDVAHGLDETGKAFVSVRIATPSLPAPDISSPPKGPAPLP